MSALVQNRKAYHDYEMLEMFEAGLVLTGTEVKSVKASRVNMRDAHVRIKNGEAFILGCHISPYEQGNRENPIDPTRTRKLLLHRRELNRLAGKVQEKGLALVPVKMYIKNRRVKLEFALARGKKLHDKRASLREKEIGRELERALRSSTKE